MPSKTIGLTCFLVSCFVLLVSCSGPQPVLYPNDHYQEVGQDQAEQDIQECQTLADEHVSSNAGEQVAERTVMGAGVGAAGGAVGGAVSGSPGKGAAIGAAAGATVGLIRGLFSSSKPNRAYMNFVNSCLKERGYQPTGWD